MQSSAKSGASDYIYLHSSSGEVGDVNAEVDSRNQMRPSAWNLLTRRSRRSINQPSELPSASQFTLARARRKSVSDPGSIINQLESVIYTAVFHGDAGRMCVVIVTSLRVVAAEHQRSKGDTNVSIIWQCHTKDLAPPVISPHSDSTGGEVLTLREKHVVISADLNDSSGNAVDIVSTDSAALHTLCNCLNIVLGNFSLVENSYYNVWVQDEREVIHIGPWQYRRHKDAKVPVPEEALYLDQLEKIAWKIVVSDETENSQQPKWLLQDKISAINSHTNILQLLASSEPSPTDNDTMRVCKEHLKEGLMTAEEFVVFMEKERLYGYNLHQSDDARDRSGSSVADHGDSTESGKRRNGALKKLRRTVRRTIKLFAPHSDSGGMHPDEGKSDASHSYSNSGSPTGSNLPFGFSKARFPTLQPLRRHRGFSRRSSQDSSAASSISEVSADNDTSPIPSRKIPVLEESKGCGDSCSLAAEELAPALPSPLPGSDVREMVHRTTAAIAPGAAILEVDEEDEASDEVTELPPRKSRVTNVGPLAGEDRSRHRKEAEHAGTAAESLQEERLLDESPSGGRAEGNRQRSVLTSPPESDVSTLNTSFQSHRCIAICAIFFSSSQYLEVGISMSARLCRYHNKVRTITLGCISTHEYYATSCHCDGYS